MKSQSWKSRKLQERRNMPKEVRSKKYPDKAPEIMSDAHWEKLKELGISNRFIAKDIEPIKQIVILPELLTPEIKINKNDKRRTKNSK